MSHAAESSAQASRRRIDDDDAAVGPSSSTEDHEAELALEQELESERRAHAHERRLDAKRKRIQLLDHLLRDLDALVYLELLTLYYLDCSFFWFLVRSLLHTTLLTPVRDIVEQALQRNKEHQPYLISILALFLINFSLHAICRQPAAGEETRGYLHGGLMIDFIGQQGPTSKWKLLALDVMVLVLQMVMVSVTTKKRALKKRLASLVSGEATATETTAANPNQDVDAEEQGVLRRSDSLSDVGADADVDEEDALLEAATSGSNCADALELLSSGQSVVGSFTLLDTLFQGHADYMAQHRQRSAQASSVPLTPATLRELHRIRTTFGAIGGG